MSWGEMFEERNINLQLIVVAVQTKEIESKIEVSEDET